MRFFVGIWWKYLTMFALSMVPIAELRGAIPLGMLAYDFTWYECFIICCIGNFIPVPFILLLIKKIIAWFHTVKTFKPMALWLEKKVEKNKDKVNKYGMFGLMLFVGIPLPMTGAWTGSLVAAVTGMDTKKAIISAICGILMAGTIITLICTGALSGLEWMLGDKMNVA